MGAISLRNVEKTYGSGAKLNKVIHGVNAEISDGEFIVIVGPSGCGKSTLLRMVAGLEEITGGEIHIGGRIVNDTQQLGLRQGRVPACRHLCQSVRSTTRRHRRFAGQHPAREQLPALADP